MQTSNYSKAVKQGDYEINKTEEYLEFKQTLPKGYYVAKVKSTNGKEFFNCPIQISDISAYAMETERDILVWVAPRLNSDIYSIQKKHTSISYSICRSAPCLAGN